MIPFVAQNPLGPFIPGNRYQIRSEDEGECGTRALDSHLADLAGASGIGDGRVRPAEDPGPAVRGSEPPSVPVADPASSNFATSIAVALSAKGNAAGSTTRPMAPTPTAASATYSGPLTFTATTTLKAIAVKNGEVSEIGTFNYTQDNTASRRDGDSRRWHRPSPPQSVTLDTVGRRARPSTTR